MATTDSVKDSKSLEESDSQRTEALKVSVKIPPFWTEKPEIWFYQIEAQFEINGITAENTKFNYLISQMEPKFIENIWDIITSTSMNKYSTAKERLLNTFKESENNRIKRLVTGIDLGDMKPSQLLQKMKSLASADISDKVLKTLWLEKLPNATKNILIVSDEELEKLAIMADKIHELNPNVELYSMSSTSANKNNCNTELRNFDAMLERISSLEKHIEKFTFDHQSGHGSRSLERNTYRSRSRSKSLKKYNPNGKLCYYHFTFGSRCLPDKCKPPCSWENPENSNRQLQ